MALRQNKALEAAIDLLNSDHDHVDTMLDEYKRLMDYDAPATRRRALALRICDALAAHAALEETVFYPAARQCLPEDEMELVDHADVEHATLKGLIERITEADADDPHFDAYVHVLGEYVGHHVEEEKNELFSTLRKQDADMSETLKAMRAFKRRYGD